MSWSLSTTSLRENQSRPLALTPAGGAITPHMCFMAGTPEGHVESIHEEEATPMNDLDDEVGGMQGPTSPAGGAAEGPTPRAQ